MDGKPLGYLLRFVQLDPFVRAWKRLGLSDDDMQQLESLLNSDPKRGVVIQGTGGVRKMRFAPSRWGTGKSGGMRTIYYYVEKHGAICLITAYDHRRKSDVTPTEKATMKALIAEIDHWF